MRIARALLLIGFGIAIGIAAAEVLLRWADQSPGFKFPTGRLTDHAFDERAGGEIDGNGTHYSFDADGFRRSSETPAPGARRILFVGDSFTQGFGVGNDETFAVATCRALRARGIDAQCLNAGVTGFGTSHELRLLRRLLAQRPVDAVVFQLCPYNDLRDDWEDGGFGVADGRLIAYDPPHIPLSVRLRERVLKNDWIRASRVAMFAANAIVQANGGFDPQSNAATFALAELLRAEVVKTAQRYRLPIVFVVASSGWQVGAISSSAWDESARIDAAVASARTLHVPWIDTREVAPEPQDYLVDDGHLSPAGNRLVGAALAATLAPLLTAPPPAAP